MTRREPKFIEQCIGCSADVAVYSDRQILDGDVMCPSCRRTARASKPARRAPAPVAIVKAPTCAHTHGWGVSPRTGERFCHGCLAWEKDC